METQRGRFTISTENVRLDIDFIHDYLSQRSYWAQGRPREVVEKAIANSLNFGVYDEMEQVGFGRLVTDYATFAWLCDVFIAEAYQGRGLGKWLLSTIVLHPELERLKYIVLATRDAHELYRKYGDFEPIRFPNRMMMRYREPSS
jgi:GNAT superfamily N-acetyltransferase